MEEAHKCLEDEQVTGETKDVLLLLEEEEESQETEWGKLCANLNTTANIGRVRH